MLEKEEACSCGEARGLERVRYFPRQLLTADDMRAEQEHARQRQRRFNRFVIGWGVVCGLEVRDDPKNPAAVWVCPGYALGPWGDEIYVPEPILVEFGRRLTDPVDPCQPAAAGTGAAGSSTTKTVYVAIRYHECMARPVRTSPTGCGCDETACEYSRLRDGVQIDFLRSLPTSHLEVSENFCEMIASPEVIPCPPCPKDPWIVLATLTFPVPTGGGVAAGNTFGIDCRTSRRILLSAARVQAQVKQSCF